MFKVPTLLAVRVLIALAAVTTCAAFVQANAEEPNLAQFSSDAQLPNNFPFLNSAGTAATFSTAGFVELNNAYHTPQGANGRSCGSCHLAQAGWSIRPIDVEFKFFSSQGTDPIFNLLDANNPNADVSTPKARFAAYSMLRKGLFRRGGAVPANAEYEIIAVDDPLGAGGSSRDSRRFVAPSPPQTFTLPGTSGGTTRTLTASRACTMD